MAVPLQRVESLDQPDKGLEVRPVRSSVDRDRFIDLQYRLYAGDPNFVPPLRMERRDFLDPKKNPFFRHAEVDLFLAWRDGRPVGRIAAVNDRNYNAFHQVRVGYFGLFECEEDPAAAKALVARVEAWAKERSLTQLLGPMNLSSNYDCGLLVEGFGAPPAFLMTYNPRHYLALFEAAGLHKAKDLLAWDFSSSVPPPERAVRIAEKVRKHEGVVIRPINMGDLRGEIRRLKEIYNAAWEKNWGFVPMTDAEFDHMAKDMKALVVPELLLFAEIKGEPVAFSMTLPDLNQALIKVPDGRLTRFGLPTGLAKLLWHQRKINRARLVTLGIKAGYRKRGLDALLCLETMQAGRRLGYAGAELSWTLEDNALINRLIESFGGRKYKTYRVYEKAL